ncbi:MAG: hypothetical protein V1899_01945 [Planctomycetota bacterium]
MLFLKSWFLKVSLTMLVFALALVRGGEAEPLWIATNEPPRPINAPLQVWLDYRPAEDLVVSRIVCVAAKPEPVDMKTVHELSVNFFVIDVEEVPSPGPRECPLLEHPDLFINGDYADLTTNYVNLMPGEYIGRRAQFSKMLFWLDFKKEFYLRKKGFFYIFFGGSSVYRPGEKKDDDPVEDSTAFNSNGFRLTAAGVVATEQAARKRALLPSSPKKVEKDADRFMAVASLVPEKNAIYLDIVCVNPLLRRVEKGLWVQGGSFLHLKTISDAAITCEVLKEGKPLKNEVATPPKEEPETKGTNEHDGRAPRMDESQLVGRILRVSELSAFAAMNEHFKDEKSRKKPLTIRVAVKLFIPDVEGAPKEAGMLTTNDIQLSYDQFQQILEGHLNQLREKKLKR